MNGWGKNLNDSANFSYIGSIIKWTIFSYFNTYFVFFMLRINDNGKFLTKSGRIVNHEIYNPKS